MNRREVDELVEEFQRAGWDYVKKANKLLDDTGIREHVPAACGRRQQR